MRTIHLPTHLDKSISMPPNAFYIGLGIVNLPKSNLYIDLEQNQYKRWLWREIKIKGEAYQELLMMKNSLIKGQELILVCSCDKKESCHSHVVKKALFYLLQQETTESANLLAISWDSYFKDLMPNLVPDNESKLHDFCFWLFSNSYNQKQLNFHHLWLQFLCLNF